MVLARVEWLSRSVEASKYVVWVCEARAGAAPSAPARGTQAAMARRSLRIVGMVP